MTSPQTIKIVASDHPVKSVVVLKSSKAEVVRTFNVALESGRNKVIVSRLPSAIDTQSVRISGLNPNGLQNRTYLSDVVCSVSDSSDDASSAAIHALETQKNILAHEKKVLDTQADVLVKYAKSLTSEHASPEIIKDFLTSFVEHGRSNIHSIAKIDTEIEEIDKKIEMEMKKASLVKGSANTELVAVITADSNTNVELKLTYIVSDTTWFPTYELHAVTGDDGQPSRTVSLHYRACITQSTGEDWTDAALTLSTVTSDAIVKRIPKLEPLKIRIQYSSRANENLGHQQSNWHGFGGSNMVPQPQSQARVYPSKRKVPQFGSSFPQPPQLPPPPPQAPAHTVFEAYEPVPPPANAPAPIIIQTSGSRSVSSRDSEADHGVFALEEDEGDGSDYADDTPDKVVTHTPMALTYSVRGKSSIPSDGKEHIVTIAVLSFETDVEYVSVPRVDPRVYLQCQVKNNSEYRLLPGSVSIILDDSYVSKTTITDVNRNDAFNFTLGDDPSVLVSYSRLSKNVKEGSGSFADIVNITTFTTSITVQNKHAFSIEKLILKDAIPISNDSRVRVVLRKPKELIEAKEGVLVKIQRPQGTREVSRENSDSREDDEDDNEGLKAKWTKEKEGLYEYRWRVDPDDKINLETVFEMKASTDLTCSFMENLPRFGH